MQYRIKVIEKNNGEKQFFPQYKYEGIFDGVLILLFPLMLIVALFKWDFQTIRDYMWLNLEVELTAWQSGAFTITESIPMFFDSMKKAEEEISKHKLANDKKEQAEINRKAECQSKKNKKVSYIKLPD